MPIDERPDWLKRLTQLVPNPYPAWDDEEYNPARVEASEELLLCIAAMFAYHDICNGGFHQFFGNPAGRLAPEAVRGFRLLGLDDAADVLATAMAYFGEVYPRSGLRRNQVLDAIPMEGDRDEWDPFSDIDERFFDLFEPECIRFNDAIDKFVRRRV